MASSSNLECPICCSVTYDNIIYQCHRGHDICRDCFDLTAGDSLKPSDLVECPFGINCGYDNPPARSTEKEKAVAASDLPRMCPNPDCRMELPLSSFPGHLKWCDEARSTCDICHVRMLRYERRVHNRTRRHQVEAEMSYYAGHWHYAVDTTADVIWTENNLCLEADNDAIKALERQDKANEIKKRRREEEERMDRWAWEESGRRRVEVEEDERMERIDQIMLEEFGLRRVDVDVVDDLNASQRISEENAMWPMDDVETRIAFINRERRARRQREEREERRRKLAKNRERVEAFHEERRRTLWEFRAARKLAQAAQSIRSLFVCD